MPKQGMLYVSDNVMYVIDNVQIHAEQTTDPYQT
jgi:hypothetical protein